MSDSPYLLKGQNALVTGASSGIGEAAARSLAKAGAAVVVNYHTIGWVYRKILVRLLFGWLLTTPTMSTARRCLWMTA
jgi:hypothetical protein